MNTKPSMLIRMPYTMASFVKTGSIIIKMVKRRVDINNRHITSFFGQGSKSKSITSNKNKPLLMSSHEVDRCNDILKARKSAISRGKDPDDAEQRIQEILKEGVSHASQVCTTSTSWQLFFAWWRSWYGSEDLKALFQEFWINLIFQAPKACATSTSWQGRPSTTNIKLKYEP